MKLKFLKCGKILKALDGVFFSFGWLPVYTQHDGLRVFNSCVNLDCSNI